MARVKVRMGYPTGALTLGIELTAGDIVEVDEDVAKAWVVQGWAEIIAADKRGPGRPKKVETETAVVKLKADK